VTQADEGFAPRRIVVALDASPGSLDALAVAAGLVARRELELLGVYVEDVELVRLGRFPMLPHLSFPAGPSEVLDEERVEAQFRAVAARARAALFAAAEASSAAGSFRVARGPVTGELLAAAGRADLLVLGCASRPLSARFGVGRTAQAVGERSRGPVLLVPRGARLRGPVLMVGGPGGDDTLAAARWLAEATRSEIGFLARGQADAQARLRTELRRQPRGVLVVSGANPLAQGPELQRLLQDAGAPVLIVRVRSG
jgi:nucleotide-binding universal stress UspA family protein